MRTNSSDTLCSEKSQLISAEAFPTLPSLGGSLSNSKSIKLGMIQMAYL